MTVRSAADAMTKISDEVLMYREKPTGRCIRPYFIIYSNGKMLMLDTGDRIIDACVDKMKMQHIRFADPRGNSGYNGNSDERQTTLLDGFFRLRHRLVQ